MLGFAQSRCALAVRTDADAARDAATRPDAHAHAPDRAAPDGAPDHARPELGRRCASDAECGAGGMCVLDFPGGLCTYSCNDDDDCGARGVCLPNVGVCLFACRLGGGECGEQQRCTTLDALPVDARRICAPSCEAPTPPGRLRCDVVAMGRAYACDPYQGGCGGALVHGSDNGAPCTASVQCHGHHCLRETDADGPTGAIDGLCFSLARQPAYVAGAPIPHGSCPEGSVPLPVWEAGSREGDTALCAHACTRDEDCRPGYACTHVTPDAPPGATSNGGCFPRDCRSPEIAALPNNGCPEGTACVPRATNPASGVCAREATDGGTRSG